MTAFHGVHPEELDTRSLLAIAEAAVDEAETTFTAAVGAEPVSYTHLTLPTNREV